MEENHIPILILYYKPLCPYCQKVLEFINSNKLKISLKNIEDHSEAQDELLHLGGKKQVPCLFIDGKPLYESQAIIDWLTEQRNTSK